MEKYDGSSDPVDHLRARAELLKDFIARFNRATLGIKELQMSTVVTAMMSGTRIAILRFPLSKNSSNTMHELLRRGEKYVDVEEAYLITKGLQDSATTHSKLGFQSGFGSPLSFPFVSHSRQKHSAIDVAGSATAALLLLPFVGATTSNRLSDHHHFILNPPLEYFTKKMESIYKDPNAPIESRIKDLLSRMTLQEKIGQMTQIERSVATPSAIKDRYIGSVLSGGGSKPFDKANSADWADMIDGFQNAALESRLGIPIIYGVDAVHGNNNVYGATIFPHNIGLGATRDADLVRRIGEVTALEVRARRCPICLCSMCCC
ncbi:Beta-glucosidase [Abeliophyllum distichum]|uniref:Beta-glucosidase n=1 Tax=Abeliophyllum distichum TaxID=126358 RepID=A0ABD1REZ2_9LAMI